MSEIKMIIDVTRQQQIEIEEYCINSGRSPSSYLMDLHEKAKTAALATPRNWMSKEEAKEQFPDSPKEEIEEDLPKKKKGSK